MKAIILDTETTGLPIKRVAKISDNNNWPYIVQISWLICDIETATIVSVKDYIVKLKDGQTIPEESTRIHGITNEKMRKAGVNITQVLEDFINDFKSASFIVAHNLNFDKTIIRVELHRNHCPNIFADKHHIEFCTMEYGTPICKLTRVNKWNGQTETKPPKLIELYYILFADKPKNLHNSLIDVLVCFRCFYKMLMDEDIYTLNPIFRDYFMSLTHQDMSGNIYH